MQSPDNGSPAFVADLHVHSRYAFACSKNLTLDSLSAWGLRKGIDLLATGDFTHPLWADELRSGLAPGPDGLYHYGGMRFVPGTEISCVYRQGGRVRRIHVLVLTPDLETAADLTARLERYGKLANDGRPTVKLSGRDLLATAVDCHPDAIVIPAHAWTPWYGLYGSRGGFDSLQECFGDHADLITAVESGLSSDPAMNRAVSELDGLSIVSFSDAHSPGRLGRELTGFAGECTWEGLRDAIRSSGVAFTTEFYPEEGKYHYSGHRKCGVMYGPEEEMANGTVCPVCGKELTLGVLHRVSELSSREVCESVEPGADGWVRVGDGHPPFARLIPLQEIIAAALGVGMNTGLVSREYNRLTNFFGDELSVLLVASEQDLLQAANEDLARGILRARSGQVSVEPGYDGRYGSISLDTG